jgi:hypothetical protein
VVLEEDGVVMQLDIHDPLPDAFRKSNDAHVIAKLPSSTSLLPYSPSMFYLRISRLFNAVNYFRVTSLVKKELQFPEIISVSIIRIC